MIWLNTRTLAISISFALAAVASSGAQQLPDPADFRRSAQAAIERIEREDGFSGVIAVARGDKIILEEAAGLADRENGIESTLDTAFPINSLSKAFAAAAILLLTEERALFLTDTIDKYYPNGPADFSEITIEQLLNHSSGIQDNLRVESYKELIRLSVEQPRVFPPGDGFLYSNAGYAILGYIVEEVSGESYEQFIQSHILDPLEMTSSGFGPIEDRPVKGYERLPSTDSSSVEWKPGTPADMSALTLVGGLYTTARDLIRWRRALSQGELLSDASYAAMHHDYGYNYGFGWRFAEKYGREMIWHTGRNPASAFAAILEYFPDDDLIVVALTNNIGVTGDMAAMRIGGEDRTFPAIAARKVVDETEAIYFGAD